VHFIGMDPRWRARLRQGRARRADTGNFYSYTSHSRGSTHTVLAPADSQSEEQFTLGNVAAELELEPRRANLLGAFETPTTGPPAGRARRCC
jgi:hypothetical protein